MLRAMSWLLGALVVVVALCLAAGCYLTELALRPRVERAEVPYLERFAADYPTRAAWFEALQQEGRLSEHTITAADGTLLHAYLIAADEQTDRTAVVVHGYTDHPFGMLQYAWIYHQQLRCNVLLPALRYHGKSGGKAIQMGWGDRFDLQAWIAHLPTLCGGEQRVVVHGLSMGGAATMMLAGEAELDPSVRCLVDDCGYMGVWEQFRKELREDYHLPTFPILYFADWICRLRFGWSFHEASALEAVARSARPMLFIHGGNDHYVPTAMVYPLHAAKQGEKALWIAPDSGHADSMIDHPTEYTEQVVEFVQRYL
ncbi:MAG: alpha/beta hydrolase [Alistipes sp.]|nr:alpha/beta hydrolase [Alistipes sp.]